MIIERSIFSNNSLYKFKNSLLKSLLSILFSVKSIYYFHSYSANSDDIHSISSYQYSPAKFCYIECSIINYSSHESKL